MAIATIKLDFGGDPPALYCPVCGKNAFGEDDEELCGHVVFVGEDMSGEWKWNNQVHEEKFLKACAVSFTTTENKDHFEDVDDYMATLGIVEVGELIANTLESPSAFMMEITTTSMACGPICGTVIAVIDYNPPQAE